MSALAETIASWPLAASLSLAALAAGGMRARRRRAALNRALHELRRPLQAIALAGGPQGLPPGVESALRLAAAALAGLEREVNGDPRPSLPEAVAAGQLLETAVRRWEPLARESGAALRVCRAPGAGAGAGAEVAILGDGTALAQAVDNLIVNAIEHGGPAIQVEARTRAGRLQIVVADSGRRLRPGPPRRPRERPLARLAGRARRGHGLAVVREVAAAHGGRLVLRRSASGTVAVLDLPLQAIAPLAEAAA